MDMANSGRICQREGEREARIRVESVDQPRPARLFQGLESRGESWFHLTAKSSGLTITLSPRPAAVWQASSSSSAITMHMNVFVLVR